LENNFNYKQGLLIDIHGQSHSENWIELGYLLTSTVLNSTKDLTNYQSSSINSLASISSYKFNDLIRGEFSLGGIMESRYNLKVVPSPKYLSPNGGNYYSGGFITKEYSSAKKTTRINAIQIEAPYLMRIDSDVEYYANRIADSIFAFYIHHKLDE
jgi:hypothetical protein